MSIDPCLFMEIAAECLIENFCSVQSVPSNFKMSDSYIMIMTKCPFTFETQINPWILTRI